MADDNAEISANEKKAAERYRAILKENVTRLVFWANVQNNFRTYYEKDMEATGSKLRALGIRTTLPSLDGTSGRIEFIKAYNEISNSAEAVLDEISAKKSQIARRMNADDYVARRNLVRQEEAVREAQQEFEALYRPLYLLRGEVSVAKGKQTTPEQTLSRGGIPFTGSKAAPFYNLGRPREKALFALSFLGAVGAVAHAQEADPVFQVSVDSAVYAPKAFSAKGYAAEAMEASIPSPDAMPTRKVRDDLFAKVSGLEPQIESLDELDRDLLYMRASRRTLDDLKAKYPQVSEAALRELQMLLKS